MKIIQVDNFDRDTSDDELIAENLNPIWAERIADLLNSRYSYDHSQYFFRAVQDDYELKRWEP